MIAQLFPRKMTLVERGEREWFACSGILRFQIQSFTVDGAYWTSRNLPSKELIPFHEKFTRRVPALSFQSPVRDLLPLNNLGKESPFNTKYALNIAVLFFYNKNKINKYRSYYFHKSVND